MNSILSSSFAQNTPLDVVEKSLIGALLEPGKNIIEEVDFESSSFRDPRCEAVLDHLRKMHDAGEPADALTVAHSIAEDPEFDTRGVDAGFLLECYQANTNFGLVPAYIEIITAQATKRRTRAAGLQIVQAVDEDMDVDDLVEFAQKAVESVGHDTSGELPKDGSQLASAVAAMRNPVRGCLTPWSDLNDRIGGLLPGRLYVVGARPGVGKSVISLQMAMKLAGRGYVSFTSLEMGSNEIFNRMMAHDLKINLRAISEGALTDEQWERVDRYVAQNPRRGILVNDDSGATLASIKKHARAAARRGPLTGIVVDYIGLVSAPAGAQGMKRHEVISELSRGLKNLARELNVPVIAVSQLNRESAGGEEKMPGIHHLRESGAVEQDADVIVLLHRDIVGEDQGTLKMLVAKNRQGTTGGIRLDFWGHYCAAMSQTEQHPQALAE